MSTAPIMTALQTASGNYAMLALDQRESLRAMFPRNVDDSWVDDDTLKAFKREAMRALTPHASAVLLDRPYAVDGRRPEGLAPGCGLIVAADVLHHRTGDPVSSTSVDPLVDVGLLRRVGADAVKFLMVWRPRRGRSERRHMIDNVLSVAKAAGVISVIEVIVRTDGDTPFVTEAERHESIFAAAEEIAAFGPDLYKAEVPGYVRGDTSLVRDHARQLTSIVAGDWVVLSNGVERHEFAAAVGEARAGGAGGFLAGRAVWADLVGRPDIRDALETTSRQRLTLLSELVDSTGPS